MNVALAAVNQSVSQFSPSAGEIAKADQPKPTRGASPTFATGSARKGARVQRWVVAAAALIVGILALRHRLSGWLALDLRGTPLSEAPGIAAEALGKVGLGHRAHAYPSKLSGASRLKR